jgi:hypothetical protein
MTTTIIEIATAIIVPLSFESEVDDRNVDEFVDVLVVADDKTTIGGCDDNDDDVVVVVGGVGVVVVGVDDGTAVVLSFDEIVKVSGNDVVVVVVDVAGVVVDVIVGDCSVEVVSCAAVSNVDDEVDDIVVVVVIVGDNDVVAFVVGIVEEPMVEIRTKTFSKMS